MDITLVDSWSEFRALSNEWDVFLQKSSSDSIFLTWDWMASWLRVWEKHYKPYVLIVRDEKGVLVGAAPFYQCQYLLFGLVKYRVLRMIGDIESGFEYPSWIAVAGCEIPVFASIANDLSRRTTEWDLVWMPRVADWHGVHKYIEDASEDSGLLLNVRPRDFSTIQLPLHISEIDSSYSKNRRQQIRRQRNKILNAENVRIRRFNNADDLPRYIDNFFELNHKRWSHAGKKGTFFRKPQEASFYREFMPQALKNGWLSSYYLEDKDGIKAIQVGYTYKKIFHQLQEGFDPDFYPGTGNVLRWYVLEDCIERGTRCYDFLGGVTEHKKRWGAVRRLGRDILIGANKMKNKVLFLYSVWPTGKYFRPTYPKMDGVNNP